MEYAYAQTAPKVGVNTSILDAIFAASPIVQVTLLSLIFMSIVCWAIILQKRKQFNQISQDNDSFLEAFWKATSLDSLNENLAAFKHSSVANIFRSGFAELQRIADSNLAEKTKVASAPKLQGLDNLARAVQRSADFEISNMEKNLTMLATTGSTGPFIGLFGTVWGIMSAFQKIGATGAASLAVVAPGISEALIATAIGLAAAIPAVIAYNHFVSRLKKAELEMQGFATDFLNIAKRNFFKDE
jgi:biopolymer transport protein TolQ